MSLFDTFRGWFSPQPRSTDRPALGGIRLRQTENDAQSWNFAGLSGAIIAPPDADSQWRVENLDSKTLSRMSPGGLIDLMIDLSPELSRGLWDFVLMFNPGWTVTAKRSATSDEPDPRGQAAIDAFLAQLSRLYVSPDVVFNRLTLAGFLRGAFFAETVLDEAGRVAVDIATPDPYSARYKEVEDPVRGTIFQLGQNQGGKWVDLSVFPTVRYVPIHPRPNSPYGRAPVAPAIFSALFLLGMLHDLRRVVQQQGYPRIDITVDLERLIEAMPGNLEGDGEAFKKWVDETIGEIVSVYSNLEPDDAYVHTSAVTINRPVGTVDASSLGAVDGLIKALERMVTRALKTMPLLMGLQEGGSETHANRQWELYAAGIKALQHLLEGMLEQLFTVALRAQGIQSLVEFRFAELRAAEVLRDEQARSLRNSNTKFEYDQGWISQDEAAAKTVEHAPDRPGPRGGQAAPGVINGDGDGEEPEQNELDDGGE